MSSQQRSTLQPSVTTTSPPTGNTDSDLFLPVWAIAVIAVAFGVTALFALIWWCLVSTSQLDTVLIVYCFHFIGLFKYAQKADEKEEEEAQDNSDHRVT